MLKRFILLALVCVLSSQALDLPQLSATPSKEAKQEDDSRCNKGCVYCSYNGPFPECLMCERRFIKNFKCDSYKSPDPTKCIIYAKFDRSNKCYHCSKEYTRYGGLGSCEKRNIPNCRASNMQFGKEICTECMNGVPSQSGESCVGFEGTGLENCVIGTLVDGLDPGCVWCKKGFFTGVKGEKCRPDRGTGCAVYHFESRRCIVCDYMNGFYGSEPWKCAQGKNEDGGFGERLTNQVIQALDSIPK